MILDLLYKVGLIVVIAFVSLFITYTCATTVMFYCLERGWGKTPTLAVSIAVAVLVLCYVRYNHLLMKQFFTKD